MEKDKEKKKKKKKKKFRGFTLVELLAVIVILAIIMVIAIPSVLETLTTAKEKSFVEYLDKVYMKAAEKSVSSSIDGSSKTCTIYNIKEMFNSTGNFEGYIMVLKKDGKNKYYITMWDGEYMIYAKEYKEGFSTSDLQDYTYAADERLTKEYLVSAAGGASCTDSSNNQIYYTGTKSNNGWTAHYTNGVMDDCYLTETGNTTVTYVATDSGGKYYTTYVIKGGKEYYCTDYTKNDLTTCTKSLECCTADPNTTKREKFGFSIPPYVPYYPDDKSCMGYTTKYEDGSTAPARVTFYGGAGLPATGYTGN